MFFTRLRTGSRPTPGKAALLMVTMVSACSGQKNNDRVEPSRSSSNDSPSSTDVEAASSGEEPVVPATPEPTPPPPPNSGPLDICTATTWTDPSAPKLEASCAQYWDEAGAEPVLRYACSCDLAACPLYVADGVDPGGTPMMRLNDCVVDGVSSGCDDSLQSACGSSRGEHGFCEREYYGLTPTRPDQNPPSSATLVCFEQSDGTHSCQCPNETELVPTDESECSRALLTACQTPCESVAGQCSPTEDGYDCVCSAGFTRTVETALCDYALFHACEPQCSNEAGACYLDPSGGPQIICRCNEDTAPRVLERDPDVEGDECRTPLVDTCGGSSEGPTAWP
jgi:hypothetical protein